MNGGLHEFLSKGMALRLTILSDMVLVRLGSLERSGCAYKLVREFGLVWAVINLEDVIRGNPKL